MDLVIRAAGLGAVRQDSTSSIVMVRIRYFDGDRIGLRTALASAKACKTDPDPLFFRHVFNRATRQDMDPDQSFFDEIALG